MDEKKILGFTEKIEISNVEGTTSKPVEARIDTGAGYSSVDVKLASELKLGPIVKYINVRNAHGDGLRPVVQAKIKIKGENQVVLFSISDRDALNYPVLIGRNLLTKGYVVDGKSER